MACRIISNVNRITDSNASHQIWSRPEPRRRRCFEWQRSVKIQDESQLGSSLNELYSEMNKDAVMIRSTSYIGGKLQFVFTVYIFTSAQYGCREFIAELYLFKSGTNCDSTCVFFSVGIDILTVGY
jgi:hypothetical protein